MSRTLSNMPEVTWLNRGRACSIGLRGLFPFHSISGLRCWLAVCLQEYGDPVIRGPNQWLEVGYTSTFQPRWKHQRRSWVLRTMHSWELSIFLLTLPPLDLPHSTLGHPIALLASWLSTYCMVIYGLVNVDSPPGSARTRQSGRWRLRRQWRKNSELLLAEQSLIAPWWVSN